MIVVLGLLLFLGLALFSAVVDSHYMLASFAILLIAMAPFFIRFEIKQFHAREIVLMAMLIAIAAVARVPFAAIPSVQPTTFVIIIAGLVFGMESGFMIGALAAIVSNMFLGQGPWTPWQMFAWGMVGLTAGALRDCGWMRNVMEQWKRNRWIILSFGFLWGFLFGWIMNLSTAIPLLQSAFTWKSLFTLYLASAYFDLLHGLSNVFFLGLFGAAWIRILQRFKIKYGLL